MKVGEIMSVLIYGKNPCKEILLSEKPIIKAYLEKDQNSDLHSILTKKSTDITMLSKADFNLRFTGNHQGIVIEVAEYHLLTLDEATKKHEKLKNPTYLMLDGITDPHNLGAIIRSAEAGGITAIILPKNRSVGITGTVAKVSSGALEYMDLIEVVNLSQTIDKLKKIGFWIVGTEMNAPKKYTEIDVTTPLCIIIGSEGKGISRLLKEKSDYLISIPMVGHVNSLNASVSAGIVIFEILKQKGL
jgi:23S rRNA (guanosine2251-2'-O)-methyltransferase